MDETFINSEERSEEEGGVDEASPMKLDATLLGSTQEQTPERLIDRVALLVKKRGRSQTSPTEFWEVGTSQEANYRTIDLTYDEVTKTSQPTPKRPKGAKAVNMHATETAKLNNFKVVLGKLRKEINRLAEEVDANKNTKKEIKEIASRLTGLAGAMNMSEVLETVEWTEARLDETKKGQKDEKMDERPRPEMKEAGTQTMSESEHLTEDLRKELEFKDKTYEHYNSLRNKKWPEAAYLTAQPMETPLPGHARCAVFWVTKGENERKEGAAQNMIRIYPELEEMEEEVGILTNITRTKDKSGRYKMKLRRIIRLWKEASPERIMEALVKLKGELDAVNREGEGGEEDAIGEISMEDLEYVFHGTPYKIALHGERSLRGKNREGKNGYIIKKKKIFLTPTS